MFLRPLIGYSISEYTALFTDSSPVLPRKQRKMPSRFAAVTNKQISQLIKQAAPEIHEEGDEVWF